MTKNIILDFLFPARCLNCGKLGNYLCPNCQKNLKKIRIQKCPVCQKPSPLGTTHPHCLAPASLDGVFSIYYYQKPLKKLIKKFKYQHAFSLAPLLVQLATPVIPPFFKTFDLLIPAPLFSKRQKDRGFNQAELLAKYFSICLNTPYNSNILKKIKPTLPQADIKTKAQRTKNIRAAFICQNKAIIKNKSIILIDDITTTYSTLTEAAKTLKRSGAKSVWGLTIAHGK